MAKKNITFRIEEESIEKLNEIRGNKSQNAFLEMLIENYVTSTSTSTSNEEPSSEVTLQLQLLVQAQEQLANLIQTASTSTSTSTSNEPVQDKETEVTSTSTSTSNKSRYTFYDEDEDNEHTIDSYYTYDPASRSTSNEGSYTPDEYDEDGFLIAYRYNSNFSAEDNKYIKESMDKGYKVCVDEETLSITVDESYQPLTSWIPAKGKAMLEMEETERRNQEHKYDPNDPIQKAIMEMEEKYR